MNKLKICAVSLMLSAFATPAVHAATARVIVGYKSNNAVTTQEATASRVQSLSASSGIKLQAISSPSPKMDVVTAEGMSSEELAQKLSQSNNVAYAEPDRVLKPKFIPSDSLYYKQWHLSPNHPASLNAESAWNYTMGNSDVTVAVLDTGVRLDHEDMVGRFLPGYDFVSADRSNDTDGWDADPSDPGDYVTEEESKKAGGDFFGCPTTSSWHGTAVSGVIAANGNNAKGIAGLAWGANVLPVRVLGKCGGRTSDIVAGMRWAAGLGVPNVSAVPAKTVRILNLSLGSSGVCGDAFRDAITEIRAKGILVVAAAGNENGGVSEPANCPGVIAVGAVRHDATKVEYSNFGPEVTLTAPGGNCFSSYDNAPQQPCMFGIHSTSNEGTTVPATNNYADFWVSLLKDKPSLQGTSFSAPLTAGTLALMWSAHPKLSDVTIMSRLTGSTKAFPNNPNIPTCPQLGLPGTPYENQCNCTKETCGAGLLDAGAAVAEAMRPVANFTATRTSNAAPVVLNGTSSAAARNVNIRSYAWEVLNGNDRTAITSPSASVTNFESAEVGVYQVKLTTTDTNGRVDTKVMDVNVSAPTPNPPQPAKSGGGGGGAADLMLLAGLVFAAGAVSRRK